MVDDSYVPTANDTVPRFVCTKTIVRILVIAEVRFVKLPDAIERLTLDVHACKNDPFNGPHVVVLVDVLFAAAKLLAPHGIQRHDSARVLKNSVRPGKPAAYQPDIRRRVRCLLQPLKPVSLIYFRVVVQQNDIRAGIGCRDTQIVGLGKTQIGAVQDYREIFLVSKEFNGSVGAAVIHDNDPVLRVRSVLSQRGEAALRVFDTIPRQNDDRDRSRSCGAIPVAGGSVSQHADGLQSRPARDHGIVLRAVEMFVYPFSH